MPDICAGVCGIEQPALDQRLRRVTGLAAGCAAGWADRESCCSKILRILAPSVSARFGPIRPLEITGRSGIEQIELGGEFEVPQAVTGVQQEIELADGVVTAARTCRPCACSWPCAAK
jgi:hypothetical protein